MKKVITFIFVIILTISMIHFCGEEIYASEKNEKALQAYKELLTNQEKAERIAGYFGGDLEQAEFALLDLNQDGVKEMVLTADKEYHTSLLTFVNGKAKCVGGSFAAGFGKGYYPNKKMFFTTTAHSGGLSYTYYKFNGKKLIKVAEKHGSDYINLQTGEQKTGDEIGKYAPYKYTVKGKDVSAKKYKAYVKKLKKGAKQKKLKYVENTESNRNKYL